MNEYNNNEINVDSLLLRLPVKYIEVLDHSLTDSHKDYTINQNTGLMIEKRYHHKKSKYQKFTVVRKGYIYEFQIKKCSDGSEALYMLVNAKMLEKNYLKGITSNNVKEIYKRLIECKVANFSYENFLMNSRCTSIEFCKNFRIKNLPEELIKLKYRLKKTAKNNPLAELNNSIKQQSLRFIKKDLATNSKPHIFIYNKELELISKSYEFASEYLQAEDITNLCRIEFRIKDKKHANHLGIKENSLNALLQLNQQFKKEILHNFTMSYLEGEQPKIKNKITPTKQMYLNCMKSLLNENKSFGYVSELLTEDLPRNRKSEKHKELKELYYEHLYKPVKIASSECEIYDVLQLYFKKDIAA